MTPAEHYAQAEAFLVAADGRPLSEAAVIIANAQAHATLSLYRGGETHLGEWTP